MQKYRIQGICSMVSPDTEHIYDLCCDHGELGKQALKQHANIRSITFLDIVRSIIDNLVVTDIPKDIRVEKKIESATNYKLPIENLKRSLIVAGVGGNLGIEILNNFEDQLKSNDEVVVSVHRNVLDLRRFLSLSSYRLLSENLIFENNQFYEILKISKSGTKDINLIGESIWECKNASNYLNKRIKLLEKKLSYSEDKASRDILNKLMNLK